jgi:hypothetical protein
MSDHKESFRNAPDWLMWTMTFINRVGFPIIVCLYLGYMQIKYMPEIAQALLEVKSTMIEVREAINANTKVLRSWKGPKYRERED